MRRGREHICLAGALVALGACQAQPPPEGSVLAGLVIGAEPIRGATIEVWSLDAQGTRSAVPRYTGQSDQEGRFRLAVGGRLPLPYLVTARGGVTTEHWSAEDVVLDEQVHFQAVVTRPWLAGQPGAEVPLALSPLTTVAAALGARRAALDQAGTYAEAVEDAQWMLDAHFELDLRQTLPARAGAVSPTAAVRYGLVLAGLSAIVSELARQSSRSIQSMNILTLTAALVEDALGPGMRLDGEGPAGPVTLGACADACRLPADTLRQALATALIRDYLPSAANDTGLGFADVGDYLLRVAGKAPAQLFGEVVPVELDGSPPVVEILPSPVYDESRDRIAFDAARTPSHVHDTLSTIDLARGFGDTCPLVYKHADLLRAPASNPLRWTVAVRDDLVGVSPADVVAFARPLDAAGLGFQLPVDLVEGPVEPPADGIEGGDVYEIAIDSANLSALAAAAGNYEISVQVKDRLGNEAAPLTGCWQQTVLAAPLWAGPFDVALGAGSFDDTRLENDNLAPVLRGDETPVLARLEVQNNTDADVYLTLGIDELVGRYAATWTSSRAFLYSESGLSDCLVTGACAVEPPPEPVSEIVPPQALPASLATLRVIDTSTGLETACPVCSPGEVRIAGRGRYEVQVVAADLGFLVAGEVDRARIAEIGVGPIGSETGLTGVDQGIYVSCIAQDGNGTCEMRQSYQIYHAITDAVVQVDSLVISAMVRSAPELANRQPQPPAEAGDSTLSAPVTTTLSWTTLDENLPDPG